MRNRTEEQRLFKLMPASFKEKCPCCKEPWKFKETSFHGARTSIECANQCFSFYKTQPFSAERMEEAWGWIWRSFVKHFGFSKAIKLCDEKVYLASQYCKELNESKFERLLKSIDEAQSYSECSGMVPSVYQALKLDGEYHIGFNFQPAGTEVGKCFHYDHGVGVDKNTDAQVLWMQ